jgi:acetyl-CoA acyltransferase
VAELKDVVLIDAVRTAFGKAGEKGIFWKIRAEDVCVPLLQALIRRNPPVSAAMVEDVIWGVANQVREQGGTLGRLYRIWTSSGFFRTSSRSVPAGAFQRKCGGPIGA